MRILPFVIKGQAIFFLAITLLICPVVSNAQTPDDPGTPFGRKYKTGERYRYRLTCEQYQNGKWSATTVSVCELLVVNDSTGIPYDEVSWLSAKTMTAKDTTDETTKARSVKPYRISLHSKGSLPIPKLEVAGMTEQITDFNTFFVAIAPQIGATTLKKPGDSLVKPQPAIGNFANGKNILKGEDCLRIMVLFTGETKSHANLYTAFMPPAQTCLSYILPEMKEPVVRDTLNNFQMVMPAGKDKFNVQYGREFFFIRSVVRKADGKLEHAEMFNALTLKLKLNCDAAYQHCQAEIPISLERKLTLELL